MKIAIIVIRASSARPAADGRRFVRLGYTLGLDLALPGGARTGAAEMLKRGCKRRWSACGNCDACCREDCGSSLPAAPHSPACADVLWAGREGRWGRGGRAPGRPASGAVALIGRRLVRRRLHQLHGQVQVWRPGHSEAVLRALRTDRTCQPAHPHARRGGPARRGCRARGHLPPAGPPPMRAPQRGERWPQPEGLVRRDCAPRARAANVLGGRRGVRVPRARGGRQRAPLTH